MFNASLPHEAPPRIVYQTGGTLLLLLLLLLARFSGMPTELLVCNFS
jgi:hypothetical protein